MAASSSRDLGEVVFVWFSSASAHRQVGAPSAALCFGLLPFAPLFSTVGESGRAHLCNLCSEGHRAEIMQGSPHTCVFSEVFRAKRKVELHLQEAANAAGSGISRWWFGCLRPCAPPSRGALALPATAQGIKMPLLLTLWLRFLLGGEKTDEFCSQCQNGHLMTCHLDRGV